jgi:hypothetical protein
MSNLMNVYKVTVSCVHHYGGGHMQRQDEPPVSVVAENGDDAVKKVKKMHASFEPQLEVCERVLTAVR